MNEHQIEIVGTVTITAEPDAPADWLTRVTQADFPYKASPTTPFSEQEGLEHLAYNAVANGVEDAARLDGWGDLDRGAVTMRVHDVEATR